MKFISLFCLLQFTSHFRETESAWTEEQYQIFEQNLVILAEKYLPQHQRVKRAPVTCPGGNGKFGFNSYSMMTAVVLGFNAVSNVIANINDNLNNNNNNNNQNDVGNVQGTSSVSVHNVKKTNIYSHLKKIRETI